MKLVTVALVALIALIQYPLWVGKGSWARVWDVDQQIKTQHARNKQLQARNVAMEAEVRDLQQGSDAIEERARSELGMIRQDEVFFQFPGPGQSTPPAASSAAPSAAPSAASAAAHPK